MDHRFKILVLALTALAPLMAACTPDTPQTQLSWDANDRIGRHYAEREAERPAPAPAAARTYVYDGDSQPAPTPRPAYRPQSDQTVYSRPDERQARQDRAYAAPVAFAWPANGRVISTFGTASNGERNDGINIATPMDAPIRAAASGTVTYSGNELKGYGNLLLIKHADNYVTAYAHADRLLVQRGDFVAKGQVIGYSGTSGDVTSPQLHFEIRHDTTPVNPSNLLVARNS